MNYIKIVEVGWGLIRVRNRKGFQRFRDQVAREHRFVRRKAKYYLAQIGRFGVTTLRSDVHHYTGALIPDRDRIHAVHCERKELRGTNGRTIMLGLKDLIGRPGVILSIDEPYGESRLELLNGTPEQEEQLNEAWDPETPLLREALDLLGIRYEM
jgi:hypothetical protein